MISDRETDIDALGFVPYTNSLSELITEKGITPFTVGIFGSWGTGKTSLMLMLKKELESQHNVQTIWFNAWKFDDEKQIWAALIQTILNQLDLSLKQNVKLKLQELRDSIEWIQFLTFLGTSVISLGTRIPSTLSGKVEKPDVDAFKQSFNFGKKIESMSEFEKKFEEFVETCDIERLVIFIDDLDRCKMDATLEILETIKLLLNSKRCVYVLGLDFQRVCDAVSERFAKDSEDPEKEKVAEDYLDKIIQLPFHIPRRTQEDMQRYLRYLFALKYIKKKEVQQFAASIRKIEKNIDEEFLKLLGTYKIEFSEDEYNALTEHDLLIIQGNEFNPRKLKRFLNIYEIRRSLSKVLELDLKNEFLIKFLLLQTKFTDFYQDLEGYPNLLKQVRNMDSLHEEEKKERIEKSPLLRKYYPNSELVSFLKRIFSKDVDPLPYLRIAQTAESEVALGEEEKKIMDDLTSDDSVKVDLGLENFEKLENEQKETIVRDLIDKTEQIDPQVRIGSIGAFGALREAIPGNLVDDVAKKVMEKTKDEDTDVRTQAEWTLKGLKEAFNL